MYTELTYVNTCLGTMGESPVLDLTVPHPYISAARMYLSHHNKLVQSNRWWFNTSLLTLTPVSGDFTSALPAGVVGIVGTNGDAYTLNWDGTIYDMRKGEAVITPIKVWVTREIAFNLLPPEANSYVADCAILQFQSMYDGDATRTSLLRENRGQSLMLLNAMHTRMMKVNLFGRPGVANKLQDLRGDRPVLRGGE